MAKSNPHRSLPPLPPGFIACSCGRAHSPAAWSKLPLAGTMDDGLGGRLELRTCPCGSTRAVQLPLPPQVLRPAPVLCMACGEYRVAARVAS